MSPLLFVIVMEYFIRLMRKISKLNRFKFHSRCKGLSLNHLIFADDLMLFSYGDKDSIELLARGLKTFEKCSGLKANAEKTSIYFGNVPVTARSQIIHCIGFTVGEMPFKYLGLPLNAKYLRIVDFDSIVDKMLNRITCWSSRNLSYSARVTLINSVLMSTHTYWAQCALLPVGVVNRITQLCRAFLWGGNVVLSKTPPVAWDWICKPKAVGGLGIRDIGLWNKAALGRYIWKIALKQDSLWVMWVHSVYIKEDDWWTYTPKKSAGWAWKKLCAIKEDLKAGFSQNCWQNSVYKISEVYKWLQGDLPTVNWVNWVWNPYNLPKHSFITWMAIQNRLRMRKQLASLNICQDASCLLCGEAEEDTAHLFFSCSYSKACI
ncbi:uncharacterized protein LOC110716560 [Chenopodium quinoa]|uniref:uncharacterized protein LOC110716560 n=1 Tax=Chenopodium quinoa TaxID=63459 RepID=UPI000B798241|nr:uncharacterized protein LOC110716560 [Chenopodium quinoa]